MCHFFEHEPEASCVVSLLEPSAQAVDRLTLHGVLALLERDLGLLAFVGDILQKTRALRHVSLNSFNEPSDDCISPTLLVRFILDFARAMFASSPFVCTADRSKWFALLTVRILCQVVTTSHSCPVIVPAGFLFWPTATRLCLHVNCNRTP